MRLSTDEVKAYIKYQIGSLWAFAASQGMKLQHVKPHGAMYNMAGSDYGLARAIADAVYEVDREIIFLALAGSEMVKAGKDAELKVAHEVFADRAYSDDGTLVERSAPGAIITDAHVCAERVVKMVKYGAVTSVTGKEIGLTPHSVCIHGDNPDAARFVCAIREALTAERIQVTALSNLGL